jgi:hypothetical protein
MKRAGSVFLIALSLFSATAFQQVPASQSEEKSEPVPASKEAGAASAPQSLSDVNLSFLKQRKGSMDWGRDPFVLPSPSVAGEPHQVANEMDRPFSLSAIIYNNGTGAAIINGRIVRTGDQIEGMEVSEVHSDRVLLKEGLRNLVLKVDPFLSK